MVVGFADPCTLKRVVDLLIKPQYLCVASSSTWSPSGDTPNSPMRQQQQQQDTPPLAARGRGGGGGGGVPRHYMGPPEDGLFHPPPQRRSLLGHPGAPQKFTFHNTRVQDMAKSPPTRHEVRTLLPGPMKEAISSRRGGYIPPGPVGWGGEEGGQRMETNSLETDTSHSNEQRDPRLKRKQQQQQQQPPQAPLPPQAPQVTIATATKRKQDIHLIVHQILSEHSYCKGGGSENEPELEKVKSEQTASTGSSFLSVNRGGVPSVSRLLLSARRRSRSSRSKPSVAVNGKGPAVEDRSNVKLSVADCQVDPSSPVLSNQRPCSSHLEEMSRFYCVNCRQWICGKCVEKGGAHRGHDYGTLQWGKGKKSLVMKVEAPEAGDVPPTHQAAVQDAKVQESNSDIKEQGAKVESNRDIKGQGAKVESNSDIKGQGAKVESNSDIKGVPQKPKIKLKGAHKEKLDTKEAHAESVRLQAEPLLGDKRPHSALEFGSEPAKPVPTEGSRRVSKVVPPDSFKRSTRYQLHAKRVEEEQAEDEFVAMDSFDLDIDSDDFSSSDEVMDHSDAETITVKNQEDSWQAEPSYIISLPTTRSHASAKPLPDAPAAAITSGGGGGGGGGSHGVSTRAHPSASPADASVKSKVDDIPGDVISETHFDVADGGSTLAADADDGDSEDPATAVPALVEAAESLKRLGGSNKNSAHQAVTNEGSTSQWSITNYDPRKNLIRISKVDLQSPAMGQETYSQLLSNRLALYASNSSPSGSSVTESCEFNDDPLIGGEGELGTPSLSPLESDASSLSSLLSEERGRGTRRGRGMRGRGRRRARKCTQMSTRRTRAMLVSDSYLMLVSDSYLTASLKV